MKAVVLKPIMWNTNSYIRPSGVPSFSGFVKQYGYGHEEWNNNPGRLWRGFKIFHTEATDKLLEYSESGDLGIIMTASHERGQYAVGVATNVFHNTDEDMELIADELNVFKHWKEVWHLPPVQRKFKNDEKKFMNFWQENYRYIKWKSPSDQFFWFKTPIRLNPGRISGKKRLAAMHSKFQGIEPDKAIMIIKPHLPDKNHPCLQWLSDGDFDPSILPKENQVKFSRKSKKPSNIKGPAPTVESFYYWVHLLHDLGKALPEFQRYLQSREEKIPTAKFPHSPWGAALAYHLLASQHSRELILPVSGHHAGLDEPGGLSARLAATYDSDSKRLKCLQEFILPLLQTCPQLAKMPALPSSELRRELLIRFIFSALVDADRLDTERHFDPDSAQYRENWPGLEVLWQRFKSRQKQRLDKAAVIPTLVSSHPEKISK